MVRFVTNTLEIDFEYSLALMFFANTLKRLFGLEKETINVNHVQ
jgi:hypothetical protein